MGVVTKTRRSDWGLNTADHPLEGARCTQPDVNPDWWTARSADDRGLARHNCINHCPVVKACHRIAEKTRPDRRHGMVLGGLFYNQHGRVSEHQTCATGCPVCVRDKTPPPSDLSLEAERRRWREWN